MTFVILEEFSGLGSQGMVSIPQSVRWSQTVFWMSTSLLACVKRVAMLVQQKLYRFWEAEAWTGGVDLVM
jgi:hypothetical protein